MPLIGGSNENSICVLNELCPGSSRFGPRQAQARHKNKLSRKFQAQAQSTILIIHPKNLCRTIVPWAGPDTLPILG